MCASVQTCVRDVRGWSEVYDSVWAELTEQLLTISKERKEIKINCLFSVFLSTMQGCAHTGRWWWLVLTTSRHKYALLRPSLLYIKEANLIEK